MLAPGWRWMSSTTAGCLPFVDAGADAVVLHAADHAADGGQPHRGAVAPGDHQVLVCAAASTSWSLAPSEKASRAAVEAALGAVDVGGGDGGADVLHRQAVGGEPRGIDPHAHRRAHAALHGDAPDAVDLGQFRLQQGVRGVADLRRWGASRRSAPCVRIGASAGFTFE